MNREVSVTFKDAAPIRINLEKAQPMTPEAGRTWLEEQFTELGCEPLRATGKVLNADKVLVVAQAAGASRFADANWALQFARCACAALGKPVVQVNVPEMTLSY